MVRRNDNGAPEAGEESGNRDEQAAPGLAFDKEVASRPVETDGSGRVVAEEVGDRRDRVHHAPHYASVGRMKECHRAPFGSAPRAHAMGHRPAWDGQ